MKPILYFSRNPNPRLAVAAARHLNAPVAYEWAAPLAPGEDVKFRPLNPSLRIPILAEDGGSLWEADAIACRLSQMVGSEFWRTGPELPDMIRWISWSRDNFMHACDMVHFERGTKLRYSLGELDEGTVARGMDRFRETAGILDAHLAQQEFLLASGLSYADFRMGVFLPFNDIAKLPLAEYPALAAWHARLMALPAWADPFDGLDAPDLPPIPG
ncbi:MAG: glutathione S-transferase family protein [Rubrivivax sp.]|nr:MAG: glutathione S-transferase family protein [Rubrivivax sp.]